MLLQLPGRPDATDPVLGCGPCIRSRRFLDHSWPLVSGFSSTDIAFLIILIHDRPDHCNGGFDQFCDSSRQYSNISLILVDSGRGDLLEYLSEYWKDFRGDDPNLWQHEWNKHGTCVSTLDTHCYEDYVPQQEVVDYFDKTAEIFKTLPSHEVRSGKGVHFLLL